MDNRQNMGRLFRELIARPQGLFGFGVGNAMEASLAVKAGAESIYNGGYTMAMYEMMPDMGMMNMVEVLAKVSNVVRASLAPVIADIDEGYGNAINAFRTAAEFFGREFIDNTKEPWQVRRLAGIHIEDQCSPKRCGHISGKDVVSLEEAVKKVELVCRVRDTLDKDAVVIARTDAYNSKKSGSLKDAIERAVKYAEAGADLVWCEFNTCERGPVIDFTGGVRSKISRPCAFNYSPSLPWFREKNPLTFEELVAMGNKYVFVTIAAGHASSLGVYDFAKALVSDGAEALWQMQESKLGHPTESHHKIAGVPVWQALERQYIPEAQEKQKFGEGFGSRSV